MTHALDYYDYPDYWDFDPYYPDYDDYEAEEPYDYYADDEAYLAEFEQEKTDSYGEVFQRHYIPAKYCYGWI